MMIKYQALMVHPLTNGVSWGYIMGYQPLKEYVVNGI
jgi:hypothetical protein